MIIWLGPPCLRVCDWLKIELHRSLSHVLGLSNCKFVQRLNIQVIGNGLQLANFVKDVIRLLRLIHWDVIYERRLKFVIDWCCGLRLF